MKVLGIETSCDETAAAVVENGRVVLSNVVRTQMEIHARFGGVVPEIASRNHLEAMGPVVREALARAGLQLGNIDGLAVTIGPGLIGALLVGVQFAKSLSLGTGLPLVGVNHVQAHVMASFLSENGVRPDFPFVALAVSGGHTSLYLARSFGDIEMVGRTVDDAAGEAFDKAASQLGLGYPGGVSIERASQGHDPTSVRFPRAMVRDGTFNTSFSGLKTALRRHLEELPDPPDEKQVGDIAASFQEAVVDVLVLKTMAAARAQRVRDVVVAGGVAANLRLRQEMQRAASREGLAPGAGRAVYGQWGHDCRLGVSLPVWRAVTGRCAPRTGDGSVCAQREKRLVTGMLRA
ncbi:MAG: tRNA (adenosine(37)-N6)-threonylcarbamoyltransferase complex transferase subunit TsaD [Deltaproteobacteria bacterium]|nr:tRNA (adenosine(37)-N6)-threonylcarbamoyltransferase complex transferase subunit TsaD [Deltaproteobacteria bacterium]